MDSIWTVWETRLYITALEVLKGLMKQQNSFGLGGRMPEDQVGKAKI